MRVSLKMDDSNTANMSSRELEEAYEGFKQFLNQVTIHLISSRKKQKEELKTIEQSIILSPFYLFSQEETVFSLQEQTITMLATLDCFELNILQKEIPAPSLFQKVWGIVKIYGWVEFHKRIVLSSEEVPLVSSDVLQASVKSLIDLDEVGRAISMASGIKGEKKRNLVFQKIVEALLKKGKEDEALAVARMNQDQRTFLKIVLALIEARRNKKALSITEEMKAMSYSKIRALISILDSFLKGNGPEEVEVVYNQTIQEVQSLPNRYMAYLYLLDITRTLKRNKAFDKAKVVVSFTIATAESFSEVRKRINALLFILPFAKSLESPDQVLEILEKSREIASNISQDSTREKVLSKIQKYRQNSSINRSRVIPSPEEKKVTSKKG